MTLPMNLMAGRMPVPHHRHAPQPMPLTMRAIEGGEGGALALLTIAGTAVQVQVALTTDQLLALASLCTATAAELRQGKAGSANVICIHEGKAP